MKQVELYNHNKTTYENITRIFETSNKCATVQPTGSGKSFLIFKLAQDNSDKTIIVFEPNRQIISRVSEQMKEYGIDNIKFYTYQKLNSQHKRDEISIVNADYICLDELHRIKAKQWEQAVIAIQEKFPNAKVLGLTATPERMDGQNIIDYFGAELACNITLGDAIVNKILPCPTYISALYTFDEEIQKVSEKIDESRNSDEEKNEMRAELNEARKQLENALGVPIILKKHIPDGNGKYIVFCQNVEHLNTMKSVIREWFVQAGFDVNMYEVHTKNPNHKIEYNQFQADNSEHIRLCLCIDMFNEGVHLEGISGVILLRPTQSNIIYFQQIGRAISASDNNTPIIFDLVNNGSSLNSGSLRTEIESAIERQREEIVECNNECDKEVFDIGNFHIYDYIKDSLDVLSGIENKCIDDFNLRLRQLGEYKNKWGHCCVMKKEAEEWEGLFNWSNSVRSAMIQNHITSSRIEKLNNIGFIWNINFYKYNKLLQYIKLYINNGNKLPIPLRYICDDGYKLGRKIENLKRQYHRNILTQSQIKELISLGIIDSSFNNTQKTWNEKYEICRDYASKTSQLLSCTSPEYMGVNIGNFIEVNNKKHRQGLLSEEQEKLYSLLPLKETNEEIWETFISNIKECINNNIAVNYKTVYNEHNIGRQLCKYKKRYRKGTFPDEKYQELFSLGIDLDYNQFDANNKNWDNYILLLKNCINNNIKITSKTIYNNINIGSKLWNCKNKYKQGKFPEERYQQLLELGIDLAKEGSLM